MVDLSIASWDATNRFIWKVDDDLHGSNHFPILMSQVVHLVSSVTRLRCSIETLDWDGLNKDICRQLSDGHKVRTLTVRYVRLHIVTSQRQAVEAVTRPFLGGVPMSAMQSKVDVSR